MLLHTFPSKDTLHLYQQSLVMCFHGKRQVLSTAPANGGYQEKLTHVFNHDEKPGAGMACTLKAPSYEEHMNILSKELGLPPDTTAGLSTAADMENVSICCHSRGELSVTAVVTAGVEINGGRVGDAATWDEITNRSTALQTPGTINILLCIEANLPPGTLARALVTCTEAKTALLQELLAPSCYSMGIATGTGTDGTILIANPAAKHRLCDAGKHSTLGELIGTSVKTALEEALAKQSNLTKRSQHNILCRMGRFGLDIDSLWKDYQKEGGILAKPQFVCALETLAVQEDLLCYTSLYAHLLDQLMWGLLSPKEALTTGHTLLCFLEKNTKNDTANIPKTKEEGLAHMIAQYRHFILRALAKA